jgi:Winged helix-turn helix
MEYLDAKIFLTGGDSVQRCRKSADRSLSTLIFSLPTKAGIPYFMFLGCCVVEYTTPNITSEVSVVCNSSRCVDPYHQVRQRAHFLILACQGIELEELMTIFNVSYKTIYNWINRWESEGMVGLYNKPGRGRKRIFKPEQEAEIREWAKQEPRQLKKTLQKIKSSWDI